MFEDVHFLLCLLFASNMAGCSKISWTNSMDVIRIQNNKSKIKTVFIPKISPNSIYEVYNFQTTHKRSNVTSDQVISTDHNISSVKPTPNKTNSVIHKWKQIKNLDYANNKTNKQLLSFSEPSKNTFKLSKEHFPNNRTLLDTWFDTHSHLRSKGNKIGKFLNLFTVINFTNEHCFTTEGFVGVCYLTVECENIGGEARGLCAQGYGVCCYVERTCGEDSAANNTYISTSGMSLDPQSGVYVCKILIHKTTPEVQQLRIIFHSFQLSGPVKGDCVIDRFVVTGQNKNDVIPPICGLNTGKHIYVDVDDANGPISLMLLSSGARGVPTNFKIQVTQLTQNHPLLAPNNCLQYYNEPQGSVESFNYIHQISSAAGLNPGYFNDLNYAVCFKKLPGYCGIVYSNIAGSGIEYKFELLNFECDGSGTVPEGQAGAERFDCPDDFIVVSGIRLCGYKLNDGKLNLDYTKNSPVTDGTSGPLMMQFHSNRNLTGRGFHLDYMLTPCASAHTLTTKGPAPVVTTLPPDVARAFSPQ